MKLLDTLLTLSQRYPFPHLQETLSRLQEPFPLKIGVLGDFNAGKSTLINAMIGKKLLPAMDRPTTSSITEIVAKDGLSSTRYTCKTRSGALLELSALEFSEIATGQKEGYLIVEVPSQGMLQKGYCLIDTPGLSSHHQEHTDITFGHLPFLDGVIICQDINKGGFTDSILQFLQKPELMEMSEGFLFLFTRADQKPPEAAEKIRQQGITTLAKVFPKTSLPLEKRVITLSPLQLLQTGDEKALAPFKEAFQYCFLERKSLLWKQRQEKELQCLRDELLFLLREQRQALQYTRPDLEQKRGDIEQEKLRLYREQHQEEERLQRLESEVSRALSQLVEQFVPRYQIASNEELPHLTEELAFEIDRILREKLQRHLDDFQLPSFHHVGIPLQIMSQQSHQVRDVASMLTTAVITAALSGGGSLALNAAEAGAGGAVQVAGKLASQQVAKGLSTQIVQGGLAGVSRGLFHAVGHLFHQINPVNHVAEFICQKAKATQARKLLEQIALDVSEQVHIQLHEYFQDEIFEPFQKRIQNLLHTLQLVEKEQEASDEEIRSHKRLIEQDINSLSVIHASPLL